MSKIPALLVAATLAMGGVLAFAADTDAPPASNQERPASVDVPKAPQPGTFAPGGINPSTMPLNNNMQFLGIQNASQMEARKFQTLSNPSGVRNDINLNPVRNIK